jgi:hypothetical protein
MATTVQIPAPKAAKRIPMTATRKTALVAGVFYLITFVSIPTLPPARTSPSNRRPPGRARRRARPFRAHRTRRTGKMAAAPMMAQTPATIYSTP